MSNVPPVVSILMNDNEAVCIAQDSTSKPESSTAPVAPKAKPGGPGTRPASAQSLFFPNPNAELHA